MVMQATPAGLFLELPDEQATVSLGKAIGGALPADTSGWMVLLKGDLGAGKSTLARAMLHSLGHAGPVPSPTYTLVEPYELSQKMIYHVDLYRISNVDELEFLGWQDLREGMILLEWPERAPALLQAADLLVELGYRGEARSASLMAMSARAGHIVNSVRGTPGLAVT